MIVAGKSAVERRREIHGLLNSNSKLSVIEMSDHFGVSAVTIRKDLRLMEEEGIVVRGHGVASQAVGTARYNLARDMSVRSVEKQRIADEAAGMVKEREVILLGPGSTCCMLAQRLCKRKNLIIVTNAISFQPYLMIGNDVQLLYLGGEYNTDNGSTVGSFAVDALNSLSIDRFFIGVTGITVQTGLSSYNFADTLMIRTMIERSKQVVVLTDHTKFWHASAIKIADLSAVDTIITDTGVAPAYVQEFEQCNVKLIQA